MRALESERVRGLAGDSAFSLYGEERRPSPAAPLVSSMAEPEPERPASPAPELQRADSSSSTSSAMSTSSIEATPFRAPPRGNLDVSETSSGRSNAPWMSDIHVGATPAWREPVAQPSVPGHWTRDIKASSQSHGVTSLPDAPRHRTPTPGPSYETLVGKGEPRMRYQPKPPSNRWMYRNGPGLERYQGPNSDARSTSDAASAERQRRMPSPRLGDQMQCPRARREAKWPGVDPMTEHFSSGASLEPPLMGTAVPAVIPPSPPQSAVPTASSWQHQPDGARTLHWLEEQHGQTPRSPEVHRDISYERSHSSDEIGQHNRASARSSISTLVPRSPSPLIMSGSTRSSTDSLPLRLPTPGFPDEQRSSRQTRNSQTPSDPGRQHRRTPADYVFGEVLGEGSYSTVLKAWDVHDFPEEERARLTARASAMAAAAGQVSDFVSAFAQGKPPKAYAIKVLDKVHILKEKKQKYVRIEKQALSLLSHVRGVVTLYHTFQDRESLYFVLELAPRCELLHYIQSFGSLDETCAAFYGAQLADVLAHIHAAGVVHRDIKPENVLLDADMRILLTDFGSARLLGRKAEETTPELASHSFVGTADYVSPELLNDQNVAEPADWWAFGCILFQMLAGRAPFRAANEYQTFQRILQRAFVYPAGFAPLARSLVDQLLELQPVQRAGAQQVYCHPFFSKVDMTTLWTCTPPPFAGGIVLPEPGTQAFDMGALDLTLESNEMPTDGHSSHQEDSSSLSHTASSTGDDEEDDNATPVSLDSHQSSRLSHPAKMQARGDTTASRTEFLLPTEEVLFSSPMLLRRTVASGILPRKCLLMLTSAPRLLCVRSHRHGSQLLGDISLSPMPTAAMPQTPQTPTSDASNMPTPASASPQSSGSSLTRSLSRSGFGLRRTPSLRRAPSLSSLKRKNTLAQALNKLGKRDVDCTGHPASHDVQAAQSTTELPGTLEVELRGTKAFVVQTPARQWHFEDPAGDAASWVQAIREAQNAKGGPW